jgi:hypothetical protein
MSANAAKLYVNTSTNVNWWTNVRIYAYNSESPFDNNNVWNYRETGVVASTETFFGKEWYVFDMGNYDCAIVQYFESSDHSISNQSQDIKNITTDRFIIISGDKYSNGNVWKWYENGFTFRCNVLNNWDATSCNMTIVDNNTLSYTLTKSEITSSGVDKIWFRILNQEGQIYPNSDGMTLALPGSTSDYYNNWTETSWSFGIEIPSYDYESIVVKASLNNTTWTVSAEAVLTNVTLTPAKTYTTLTSAYNLDFTGTSLKAFIVTDENVSDSKVTMTQVNKVPAGTGLVIKAETTGTAVTVPVFDGSNADDVTGNKMEGSATEETEIAANAGYILKDGAFHPSNGEGKLAAGKAYLHIAVPAAGAPALSMDFGEGTTGIQVVERTVNENQYYTLDGRRVIQPTKGLYIVNGKKVIVK